MTAVIRTQLTGLARTIADLRERVRAAVAGELGRAVSGAVRQVVQAVVSGRADPPRRESPPAYRRPTSPAARWDDEDDEDGGERRARPRDPWADDPDADEDAHTESASRAAPSAAPSVVPPAVTAAVAAGVYAARWWAARQGTLLVAAGLGLGVGLLGVFGGPVVRTAVAVLAGAADIVAAADGLGAGAARLEQL